MWPGKEKERWLVEENGHVIVQRIGVTGQWQGLVPSRVTLYRGERVLDFRFLQVNDDGIEIFEQVVKE